MASTDYRALCQELFGTDDPEQLRRLAAAQTKKNARNAGRKKALSPADISEMENMLGKGTKVREIAEHFHISRQSVSQYLNERPGGNFTLRIDFKRGAQICTVIYVDFAQEQIVIQNRTDDLLSRAFGVVEAPTWQDFQDFLRSRCFPESRGYLKQILRGLGVNGYDPLEIAEVTNGRTAEDNMYMTFRSYSREGNAYEEN